MKKKTKISIICIVILIMLTIVAFVVYKLLDNIRYKECYTIQGVVVRVHEKSITVMGTESWNDLYNIGFTDEGDIGFEKGQEVIVYFNGYIQESYPATPTGVKKIKIIKNKSNIEIPEGILRFCYSSESNVKVKILELHDSGIALNIEDTNELPYEISHEYTLSKEVEQPVNYIRVMNRIQENYSGTVLTWKELDKILDISCEETEIKLQNTDNSKSNQTIKFDWTKMYGKLQPRKV